MWRSKQIQDSWLLNEPEKFLYVLFAACYFYYITALCCGLYWDDWYINQGFNNQVGACQFNPADLMLK